VRGCVQGNGRRGWRLHRIPAVEILREDIRAAARPDRHPGRSPGAEIRRYRDKNRGGVFGGDQSPGHGRAKSPAGTVRGETDLCQCPDGAERNQGVLPDRT